MSNPTVPAAAEGMPERTDYSTSFANLTNVVALAVAMLIENYEQVDKTCVLPIAIADQVISLLVLARDACEAEMSR